MSSVAPPTPSSTISHSRDGMWSYEAGDVTRPPLECCLNWVIDPVPPPSRHPDDLAASLPSENTPPQDASSKLPRKLRLHRRKERQPGSSGIGSQTANRNSAFQGTGSATRPRSTANENSAFRELAQRPGRGQRPMTIHLSLGIGLESTGQ